MCYNNTRSAKNAKTKMHIACSKIIDDAFVIASRFDTFLSRVQN